MSSSRILIVTTKSDHSISLFEAAAVNVGATVTVTYFEEDVSEEVHSELQSGAFSALYLRDPFNTDSFDLTSLRTTTQALLAATPATTYIVDHLSSFDDVLFEDKWLQYEVFKEFMPATALLSDTDDVTDESRIVKKRISSRSRGIVFTPEDLEGKLDDYIIQETVAIEKEFRVFAIGNVIEPIVAIRTSKTKDTKMKMAGIEEIMPALQTFAENLMQHISYDLTGLDIVESAGSFYLLEVNRSPQFSTYEKLSNVPIAEKFLKNFLD